VCACVIVCVLALYKAVKLKGIYDTLRTFQLCKEIHDFVNVSLFVSVNENLIVENEYSIMWYILTKKLLQVL
jgi:hypothetical protein